MTVEVDHLVVVADTLEQGAAWCEATLQAHPIAGGRHALMGTHNLLLGLTSPSRPAAYLEIISIDPDAPSPARPRWFGMDEPALREAVRDGPRLVHWVGRSSALARHCESLRDLELDPGDVLSAQRETTAGMLRWLITVPRDGRPLCHGALPTLIEWQGPHPSLALPACGVSQVSLELEGVPEKAWALLDLQACPAATDGLPIRLTLRTPRGATVTLEGGSIDAPSSGLMSRNPS